MMQCEHCDGAVATYLAQRPAFSDALQGQHIPSEAEVVALRLRASGLPEDYTNGARGFASLPDITADAVTMCQMLGRGVSGLYIWGEPGTYKTSVAAAHLAHEIHAGASGTYVFVPDLMDEILASYADESDETALAIIARLIATPRLILDELGKEKRSEHSARRIFQILDGRYRRTEADRWLIVISKDPLAALCGGYHDDFAGPICRRLSEMTVSVPMERDIAFNSNTQETGR